MAYIRRDDTVQDNTGNAIAGARVYYLTQPANLSALTPLANLYADTIGTPIAAPQQPQYTDGSGHVFVYLADGQLYTVVYVYPNGTMVIYPDQFVGSSSGSPNGFAGIPQGALNGTNRVFTLVNGTTALTAIPSQIIAWLNFPLIQNLGYSLSLVSGVAKITYATAPISTDAIYAQGSM